MSCDAVAAAAFLFFASNAPGQPATQVPAVTAPPTSVATEPLFIDIVGRARTLQTAVKASLAKDAMPDIGFLGTKVAELSDLDMQGHLLLKARGTDGDLKCILRGISQDLTVKLTELSAASTKEARTKSLKEMSYLLNDNIEVILAPPAPPV